MFADDMQGFKHNQPDNVLEIVSVLEDCATDVNAWCAAKRMQLNPEKTEVLWFGTAANLPKISPDVSSIHDGSTVVTPTTVVRNLGVMLDAELSMREERSHVFTTGAECVLSVGNLAVISLPDCCLHLSCCGWIIVTSYSPAFQPQHWRHCRGCSMPPLVWFMTPRPHITGSPGIALATDRQEDRLQAVPVGPQGVDQAGANVHRQRTSLTC